MARIRTIKPEFYTHEDLYLAEVEEKLPLRIAFSGIWTICDREGRFKWRPNTIKLSVLPFDDVDFSRVLDALGSRGFIEQYVSETGELFGFVPSFLEHQVINNRESKSLIPSPFDACSTRDPRGLCKMQGKGKEGKGREREGKESAPRATRLPADWVLPKLWGEWALTEKPLWDANQVRKVAAIFRDHWIAASGKGSAKLDWEATWRNWVRKESDAVRKVDGAIVGSVAPLIHKCGHPGCERNSNLTTSKGHRCTEHM